MNSEKSRINITLDKELLDWIDEKVEESIFATRSHCFEYAVKTIRKRDLVLQS